MSASLRIALTGGIGSGKSTIANEFEKLGVPIIDADVISKIIVEPNKPCYQNIINTFGFEFISDDGNLDRNKLRSFIFANDLAKKKLEDILHPAIYQEIKKQILLIDYPYCLVVVPLLIETKAIDQFDKILVADTAEDLRIKRACSRDKSSEEEIKKIIKSQASQKQRLKYADDIINNSLTIEELKDEVAMLHNKYMKLSSYNFKKN